MPTTGEYLLLEPLGFPVPRESPRTFRAYDTHTAEVVVLQRRPQDAAPPDADDLAACRAIDSGRVARFLGGGEEQDPALIHEWVGGIDLQHLRAGKRLPADVAVVVAYELVSALAVLHARGQVHGDVHSGNVHVQRRGTVHLVGHHPGLRRIADPDRVLRRYQAPEVLAGGAPSAAADVYSLGLVLFELLIGKPLFPRADLETHRKRQAKLEASLSRAVRVREGLPEPLSVLLESTLRWAREARPASAVPLRKDLVELVGKKKRLQTATTRLRGRLPPMLQAARFRLMQQASELAVGAPLRATSLLLRAAELDEGPDPVLAEPMASSAREVLWSLVPRPSDEFQARFRATAVLLYRVAESLGDAHLQALLRMRLRNDPVHLEALEPHLEPHDLPAEMVPDSLTLRHRLAARPGDEEAALALVIRELDDPPATTQASRAWRAACLASLGQPASALLHHLRDLAERGGDAKNLEAIAGLAQAAHAAVQGSQESAPTPAPQASEVAYQELPSVAPPAFSGEDDLLSLPPPLLEEGDAADQVEVGGSTFFREADELFRAGRDHVEASRVSEALAAFEELVKLGRVQRDRYLGPLTQALQELAWSAMVKTRGGAGDASALRRILAFSETLGPRGLAPILEQLVVRALPRARRREALEALLGERPMSVAYLQAGLDAARDKEDSQAIGRHLVALGSIQLERGEVAHATRAFREAEALDAEADAARQGMETVLEAGGLLAGAAEEYRAVETAAGGDVPALDVLEAFLARFPTYEPALSAAATASLRAGDAVASAKTELALARRALIRGEREKARARLRKVLAIVPERDDVLLLLAALAPPSERPPQTVFELKMQLLFGEELYATAAHLCRAEFGKGRDLEVLEWLAEVALRSGSDPSRFRVEQGKLACRGGDKGAARKYFEEALGSAFDARRLVDELLQVPEVLEVYDARELLERRP